MRNAVEFDPPAVIRSLNQNEVDYIAVGVFGAILLGSPLATDQVAILTPTAQAQSVARVRKQLGRSEAQLEVQEISDTHLFQGLKERSSVVPLYATEVRVAALADIIQLMADSCSLIDQAALPHLYALEDEIAALERERRE